MSAANGSAVPGSDVADLKGKGKSVDQPTYDQSMDEEEDSSDEESGNDDLVGLTPCLF